MTRIIFFIILGLLSNCFIVEAKEEYQNFWKCKVIYMCGTCKHYEPNRIIFEDGRSFEQVDAEIYRYEGINDLYKYLSWYRNGVLMCISDDGSCESNLLKDEPFDGIGKMIEFEKYGNKYYKLWGIK